MGWEGYFCIAVLLLVLAGLSINVSPDALLLGGVVLVTITGIISPQEALSGFSNEAVLTVGALYVIAAGLRATGALDRVSSLVLGKARSERQVLLRLASVLPGMSAFLNNTPIVAMFIPVVSDWCKKHGVKPSRLLLPISYLCMLGGTCTLIGTSTNLVVNGLLIEAWQQDPGSAESLRPMHFFELAYVGLPYAVVGVIYLLLAAPRLLPYSKSLLERFSESSRNYLVNLRIQPGCELVGQSIEQAGLRNLPGLFLVEIERDDQVIAPVTPNQILRENDTLTFTGVVTSIADLEKIPGLVPVADEGYQSRSSRRRAATLCEAVVSPRCPCVGKTIRQADFRALYNAAVIAVHRGRERLAGKVGDIVLHPGDTLLVQAAPHFVRANRNNPDFLLVSGLDDSQPVRYEKATLSLILVIGLVVLMVSGATSIVMAALLVAGLMVITRCISISEGRRSIDWRTLVAIASALGLAKALAESGCAGSVASFFVSFAGNLGPYAVLAALYLVAVLFAALVGNNAAAALAFPFAVALGHQLDISSRPLVMAIVFAASASFISPLSYQTNLMVYGPGGYRFADYIRVGLPLTLLLLGCAVLIIPQVWGF